MKYIIFFLFGLLITSCEPGYRVYIYNKSPSNVYLKIKPSIESRYSDLSTYRDSILKHKVSEIDGFSTYRIKPNDRFLIMGAIGGPSVKYLPFDWIELISAKDTIILDSKEKIFKELVRAKNAKRKGKGGDYYIEIIK
ncbi:MAG: hypothetical protein ABI203_11860 [Mucilaginibacter sp.]